MSKITDDIRAGLKGIRGAGDVIRGKAMEAADNLFDPKTHETETNASKARNRALADQGVQDIKDADRVITGKQKTDADAESTTSGTNAAPGPVVAIEDVPRTDVGSSTVPEAKPATAPAVVE